MAWPNKGATAMNPATTPGPGAAQTQNGRQMHVPDSSNQSRARDKKYTRTLIGPFTPFTGQSRTEIELVLVG
jgi:hypothetical protein